MRVILSFVPPGGGEQVACSVAELPGIPSPGDYISLASVEADGQANFIVRRTWWRLDAGGRKLPAKVEALCIECEIAEGPFQSESHNKVCELYRDRGNAPRKFEELVQ